jgi:hypothetical protein
MSYKLKWRANGKEPLQPETFEDFSAAKERARLLLAEHGISATIEVWNADETWQIVSPTGVEEWIKKDLAHSPH